MCRSVAAALNTEGEGTAMVVKHCSSTVKNADQVYVLDEGLVIESGSYHELWHREDGQFREMVEMQIL